MNVVCDTSVVRNLAVLGWHSVLAAVCGGKLTCVADVAVVLEDGRVGGEIADIRAAIDDEAAVAQSGSSEQSMLVAAIEGIDALARTFADHVTVCDLEPADAVLAVRLGSPAERGWRRGQGLPATPLGAGEAASIAVAVRLGAVLATDDVPARRAYERVGGSSLWWTTDVLQHAVDAALVSAVEASSAFEVLRSRYRFHAPDVTFTTRPAPARREGRGTSR